MECMANGFASKRLFALNDPITDTHKGSGRLKFRWDCTDRGGA